MADSLRRERLKGTTPTTFIDRSSLLRPEGHGWRSAVTRKKLGWNPMLRQGSVCPRRWSCPSGAAKVALLARSHFSNWLAVPEVCGNHYLLIGAPQSRRGRLHSCDFQAQGGELRRTTATFRCSSFQTMPLRMKNGRKSSRSFTEGSDFLRTIAPYQQVTSNDASFWGFCAVDVPPSV